MSLFSSMDMDKYFLSYADIESIKNLSLANKYYYNLTYEILKKFRYFFGIRKHITHIIKCKHVSYDMHDIHINPNEWTNIPDKTRLFIQSIIYNDIDIFNYIDNKLDDKYKKCLKLTVYVVFVECKQCLRNQSKIFTINMFLERLISILRNDINKN